MNQQSNNYQKIQFKNWIKNRFISEFDISSMSLLDVFLWAEALGELSRELIHTYLSFHFATHEIVPFLRRKG